MIKRLAHRLGYISGALAQAREQKLREQLGALREERQREAEAHRDEKRRHEVALARLAAEHERRLAKVTDGITTKAARERTALQQQLEASVREGRATEEQVAAATRDLEVAREQLMAIEVKLDILEGAANVLDGRLRAARAQREGRRGESVNDGYS